MTFEEKVKSMTAKEIVLAMIDSLRNPETEIDMGTYGDVVSGKCYGCAATNTIIKLSGCDKYKYCEAEYTYERAEELNTSIEFIRLFEDSIDYLRMGLIDYYNDISKKIGVSLIEINTNLNRIENGYTEEDLIQYEKLAEML